MNECVQEHLYFCETQVSKDECVCECKYVDPLMISMLNEKHEKSANCDDYVHDVEELPLNMGAIRLREHKYYYKIKCPFPRCNTQYKFACKCNAAQLLLFGCAVCMQSEFEVLERWHKKNNKMVGKTELRLEAVYRIINDVYGQNHKTTCSPLARSSSKMCRCPCSCSCGCSWADKNQVK